MHSILLFFTRILKIDFLLLLGFYLKYFSVVSLPMVRALLLVESIYDRLVLSPHNTFPIVTVVFQDKSKGPTR